MSSLLWTDEGDEVALTVRGSQNALARLAQMGIEHRVMDLNLDEIFEAYVAGGKDARATEPNSPEPVSEPAGE